MDAALIEHQDEIQHAGNDQQHTQDDQPVGGDPLRIAARVVHRPPLGHPPAVRASLPAVAALGGLLWFAFGGLSVAALFVTSGMLSIGNGLAMPSAQVGAMNVMPRYAGTASGGAAFLQTMMGAIFAQVAGSLVTTSAAPLFVPMLAATIPSLAFATLPALYPGHRPRGRPAAAAVAGAGG